MNDKDQWTGEDEARLARLMRTVPRGAPDPAARARAFAAAQAEWRALKSRHTAPRATARARWLAAASLAVVALAGLLWWQPFAPQVARLDRAFGSVTAAGETLANGAQLRRGAKVATGLDAGALLTYSPALSLRLDAGTRVTLEDAGNLQLDSGRVYVAVAPGADVSYIVHTAAGDVRHVGTHYAVSVHGSELEVAVREGSVQVDADSRTERAFAGEALRVDAAGNVGRRALVGDAAWAWVGKLPAPVAIEGRSLDEFLRWYSAETGRPVSFADERSRMRAASAILHGSVDGLPPDEALAIVTASVDLRALIPQEGAVVIGPAPH